MLLALFAGEMEALELLPPGGPQMVLGALTLLLLAAYAFAASFRGWVDSLDVRAVVGFHLVRFVGIYFLILESQGRLPAALAISAGIGDIAVAVGALFIVCLRPLHTSRGVLMVWNALGLADILFVVATLARLGMTNPAALESFLELPLSFLPTMVVPAIIFSHVILFVRWMRGDSDTASDLAESASPGTVRL